MASFVSLKLELNSINACAEENSATDKTRGYQTSEYFYCANLHLHSRKVRSLCKYGKVESGPFQALKFANIAQSFLRYDDRNHIIDR